MKKVEVNFLEFLYLVESCMPPRATAKELFFNKLSDHYYHLFDNVKRDRLLSFVKSRRSFNLENELIFHFVSRYDPNNQFMVKISGDKSNHMYHTYLHKGHYYFSKDRMINNDDIELIRKKSSYEQ